MVDNQCQQGVTVAALTHECFLTRYSELLWEDRRNPKCSILPLLCRETLAADRLMNPRLVLHYRPVRGKKCLVATTKSMRPGLTHLAIRCSLPANATGALRDILMAKGQQIVDIIIEQIGQVLNVVKDTCTLRELVLDLRDLEQYVEKGVLGDLCTSFQNSGRYPELSSLVMMGGLREADGVLKMLQKVPTIKDFHVETFWGTVTCCSESRSVTVVIGNWIEWRQEIDDLTILLRSRGDLLSLHLIVRSQENIHEQFTELEISQILDGSRNWGVQVDLYVATFDEELFKWFGGQRLELNFYDHHWYEEDETGEDYNCIASEERLEYESLSVENGQRKVLVQLYSEEPWAEQFARYLETLHGFTVVWVDNPASRLSR